jgi:hypothetical protein
MRKSYEDIGNDNGIVWDCTRVLGCLKEDFSKFEVRKLVFTLVKKAIKD